jgi:hypothetical protein
MVIYRGLADDLALMDWLQKHIFPAEAKTVSPEMVRTGTRLAALEMIESGTTTFADMYYFEEEIAKTTVEAGLRAVLGETIIQFPVADAKTPAEGPGTRGAVHPGVQGQRSRRAGRGPARALHQRSRDARGIRRAQPALRRADDYPLRRNRGRSPNRAGTVQGDARGVPRSRSASGARTPLQRMPSGSRTRTSPSSRGGASGSRTTRKAT